MLFPVTILPYFGKRLKKNKKIEFSKILKLN